MFDERHAGGRVAAAILWYDCDVGRFAAKFEKQSADGLRVTLEGPIDEHAELDDIFGKIDSNVVFDLAEVNRINSPGVLRWIRAMQAFTSQHQAAVERVSYPMAVQAMCLRNMFPNVEVRSCLAPYFCAACGTSHQVPVTAGEVEKTGGAPPSRKCPECDSPLDFDELDAYFAFLADSS